jgi:hypothetical protein
MSKEHFTLGTLIDFLRDFFGICAPFSLAVFKAIATACFSGLPAARSVAMLLLMASFEVPCFNGINHLSTLTRLDIDNSTLEADDIAILVRTREGNHSHSHILCQIAVGPFREGDETAARYGRRGKVKHFDYSFPPKRVCTEVSYSIS